MYYLSLGCRTNIQVMWQSYVLWPRTSRTPTVSEGYRSHEWSPAHLFELHPMAPIPRPGAHLWHQQGAIKYPTLIQQFISASLNFSYKFHSHKHCETVVHHTPLTIQRPVIYEIVTVIVMYLQVDVLLFLFFYWRAVIQFR